MTSKEIKRRVGYFDLVLNDACGICRRCRRDSNGHLRCGKFGFMVSALGICRDGYERVDLPLNRADHPLLVKGGDNDQT